MKKLAPILSLLLLASCVEQLKSRVQGILGMSDDAETTPVVEEYVPEPPPTLEQDKIVQVSPKERLLSLFEQFNRSPDATIQGIVLQEFANSKNVFTTQLDPALETVINRTIPNIQQGDRTTLDLLVQLLPLLTGENKEHLFAVLARGFDSTPAVMADLMGRRNEDKLCNFILEIPPEVTPEAKRDFLESRVAGLQAAKSSAGNAQVIINYLDACLRTLELNLTTATDARPTTEPVEPPVVEPVATPEPAPAEEPVPTATEPTP